MYVPTGFWWSTTGVHSWHSSGGVELLYTKSVVCVHRTHSCFLISH